MFSKIVSGYRWSSLVALGILGFTYLMVGIIWNQYIDISRGMDWLLVGIWAFMTAILCWNISAKRDLTRVLVGFIGGLVIESWGTVTSLWSYFTTERPPLWILPAWPVAALAIDRMAQVLDSFWPVRGERLLWWCLLPPFFVLMARFITPTHHLPATWFAVGAMVLVLVSVRNHREDNLLFIGGAMLGVFLEYWGTSRYCWTYYTREVPPMEAALAHGFASVAFARGVALVEFLVPGVRTGYLKT